MTSEASQNRQALNKAKAKAMASSSSFFFCSSGLNLTTTTSTSIALQQHSHTPAAQLWRLDVAGARDREARQLSVWACGLNIIVVA